MGEWQVTAQECRPLEAVQGRGQMSTRRCRHSPDPSAHGNRQAWGRRGVDSWRGGHCTERSSRPQAPGLGLVAFKSCLWIPGSRQLDGVSSWFGPHAYPVRSSPGVLGLRGCAFRPTGYVSAVGPFTAFLPLPGSQFHSQSPAGAASSPSLLRLGPFLPPRLQGHRAFSCGVSSA